MGAAGFVLAINIFVTGLFTAAFGALAWRNHTATGAGWLALAYGLGVVNCGLEYILPHQQDPRLLSMVVFSVSLGAFLLSVVGLATHYAVRVPTLALMALGVGSLLANIMTIDLPANTLAYGLVYQIPFFTAHLLGAYVVFRAARLWPLDITLLVFLLVSGLQFLIKPFLAVNFGYEGPHVYLQGLYGAFSQMMIAFLLIANGVLMLLIIVRDVMAEITLRSETDALSGLFNRRGLEERAEAILLQAIRQKKPCTIVVADLDHFKQVNDRFGHESGDRVIAAFANILASALPPNGILARVGGEEFVAMLPDSSVAMARLFSEAARNGLLVTSVTGLPQDHKVTASFGVATSSWGDTLSDLMRRADSALYEAKNSGRNRVSVAQTTTNEPQSAPAAGRALR